VTLSQWDGLPQQFPKLPLFAHEGRQQLAVAGPRASVSSGSAASKLDHFCGYSELSVWVDAKPKASGCGGALLGRSDDRPAGDSPAEHRGTVSSVRRVCDQVAFLLHAKDQHLPRIRDTRLILFGYIG
jgi:hypothetical protein